MRRVDAAQVHLRDGTVYTRNRHDVDAGVCRDCWGRRQIELAKNAKGLPEEALPLPCLEAAAQRSPTSTVEAVLMRTAICGL